VDVCGALRKDLAALGGSVRAGVNTDGASYNRVRRVQQCGRWPAKDTREDTREDTRLDTACMALRLNQFMQRHLAGDR